MAGNGSDVDLGDYLADCREAVLAEMRRLLGDLTGHGRLYQLLIDYPTREGKALRPTLAIATCRAAGGDAALVLRSAATLELYHNAFLIHDDIEDESLMRRGKPTMHLEHGVPIAINVGDAMLALSLRPLLANVEVIGLGPALRVLESIATMTQRSVEGQAQELEWVRNNVWELNDGDYAEMVVAKTGWYSFIVPMQIGAICARADRALIEQLARFGRPLSIAFQITDDLLNLQGEPEQYGKEIAGDLWEGKRTVMLLHTLRTAEPETRREVIEFLGRRRPNGVDAKAADHTLLDELVASGELTMAGRERLIAARQAEAAPAKTIEDVRWLHRLLHEQGSMDHARSLARHYAGRAAAELDRLDRLAPSRHRRVLELLVDYVWKRTR